MIQNQLHYKKSSKAKIYS
jgi:serine/threonine protein kinase